MAEKQASGVEVENLSTPGNNILSRPAHTLTYGQARDELQADFTTGLGADEAATRLAKYGANNFGEEKGVQPLQILIAQVVNAMTLVLLLALAASFAIHAWIEGGVLAALILINIVIGFFQDLQAARTIASLKSLSTPSARVFRDGSSQTVDASQLVPGDIIELKVGDSVPADGRVFEAVNLEADEALLTGESLPVRKDPEAVLDEDTGPGDRINIVFSSSIITKGRGRAVVVATGMNTEIGAIAAALREEGGEKRKLKRDENGKASFGAYIMFGLGAFWDWLGEFLGVTVGTPLQQKLARLFLYVFGIAIVCAIIVLAANKASIQPLGPSASIRAYALTESPIQRDVIIYAVATALGTLPVTLILVLTVTMAAGTKVMVRRNVVVRNMRSLEALGGVTNICSDKTGTLTQGKMVTRMAWIPFHGTYSIDTSNDPYNPEAGTVTLTPHQPSQVQHEVEGTPVQPREESHSAVDHYLDIASIANLAVVKKVADEDRWEVNGDPTEIAIRVFAARFGRSGLNDGSDMAHVAEFPFDSSVKKMSMLCRSKSDKSLQIYTKGAVERVLESCSTFAQADGDLSPLTEEFKSTIVRNMEALARRGLRVLAFANGSVSQTVSDEDARQGKLQRNDYEQDLTFRGLVGIYDPPRPESRPSVFKCHQADIKVHMLTGDHPETARSIAIEVGILPSHPDLLRADIAENLVMTAHQFDALTDEEVDNLPELPLVVARCAPSTKVRMIDALHRRGCYVAMTGDGVNDSPSLKRADIGIAMGLGGSDVAKSASDIILSDDNFASILNAVEEGRRIFDNVQKFMLHVLAANVGFVCTLLIGLMYKDDSGTSVFQVTPVEILFMLLVAGAFTETGLGFESASPDILRRPPQSLKYGVFTPEFIADIVAYGIIMAVTLLSSFSTVLYGFYDGNLGHNCNVEYSDQCHGVFRSRTTCYTVMMWAFSIFAWELVDFRRSFFDGVISDPKGWALRLWRNPFLFWSVLIGFFSTIPTIYIPVINRVVFLHGPIDREWGIIFAISFFFLAGAETWKFVKRIYLRRNNLMHRKDAGTGEADLEKRTFERFYDSSSVDDSSN
ncbi:unnamed protein product [Clonostachys rosea]|uniref:P-type Na(+) transporter n=1 Tax=Bionectria ochroleuca TaxID=29856 RepID=A0ABY6V5I1_BIOOC|nr:unnamed protein product [Clonostachys rosea]